MFNRNTKKQNKKSHKLWSASMDDGKLVVKRSETEQDFDDFEYTKAVVATHLGLWGSSLTDYNSFNKLSDSMVGRFERVASSLKEAQEAPKVYSWVDLNKAFTETKVAEVRDHIVFGMKTRQLSKYLDIPFVGAADFHDDVQKVGKKTLKKIVRAYKAGKRISQYGKLANKVKRVLGSRLPKVSVDQAAEDYYKAYYGPYGDQLVKEVKKRVKADLAKIWLVKQGVDESAADYWQNYFIDGAYGQQMTKDIPKRLSPKASR
jgi:hypothetical protein